MRAVVIFLLAFIAIAAARTTFKRGNIASALLRKLQQKKLSQAQNPQLARSSRRLDAYKGTGSEAALLKQLLKNRLSDGALTESLRHLAKSKRISNAFKRTGEEDYCQFFDEAPCVDISDNDEFYVCVVCEAFAIEEEFSYIYHDISGGEELLTEDEMDALWEVRFSDTLTVEQQEEKEEYYADLAESRFNENVDWESLNADTQGEILELDCHYSAIKDEAYNRAEDEENESK